MNSSSYKRAFDDFKNKLRNEKQTKIINERRHQLSASKSIDFAYLGYDFFCMPDLEEDTALLSYVVDGTLVLRCISLNEYMALSDAVYDYYNPPCKTNFLEDEDAPCGVAEDLHHFNEDEELQEKLKQLKTLAEELRLRGVSEDLIHLMVSPEQKLSGLHISSDLQIIMENENQERLDMRPLPKALYLLFLKHPEGIAFKELIDYRDELLEIYNRLSPKRSELNEKSIDDLVSPINNSANEKCSRIRAAFVKLFDEATARHYYIDGKRGEKKKITLDRNLISWDD